MTTSNDLLNTFIHDLNQPLQVIIGISNTSLLDVKNNRVDKEKLEENLTKIRDAATRIIELSHATQFKAGGV